MADVEFYQCALNALFGLYAAKGKMLIKIIAEEIGR